MLDGHPSHAVGVGHYPSLMAIEKKRAPVKMDWWPSPMWENNPCFDGILRERSCGTNTPSRLRGVRGARMGMNGKWQCTGRMPGKCHTKDSSWQTTSRAWPLPSEKKSGIQYTETAVSSELLQKLNILEDRTTRTTVNWITNSSKQQLQANQDKETPAQSAGIRPSVQLRAFRSLTNLCTVRSRLLIQWQARVACNHHHSSQTDKPEPTSDALGALAGKNTLMTQVQGKSWSHWQFRALQKTSDMSPSRASAAKHFNDTHHAIEVWVPAFRC